MSHSGSLPPRNGVPLIGAGSLAVVTDASRAIVTCTPAIAELLGIPADQLRGRVLGEIVKDGLDRTDLTAFPGGAPGGRTAGRGRARLQCLTGPAVTLDYSISPFRSGGGASLDLIIFTFPAETPRGTDREPPGALQLVEEDPSPVLRISRDGIVLYANRSSWALLAYWRTQVGASLPASWASVVREALEKREPLERDVTLGFRSLLLTFVPVVDRGFVNLYGIDMTRRRRAEEKVRLSAQVFESVAQAIVIMDADLRVLSVNDAFSAISGFSEAEVLGEAPPGLDPKELGGEAGRGIAEALKAGGRWQGELVGRRRSGESYPQWLSLGPVVSPERTVTGYIAIFSDITSLKQTEEQLYTMAHFDSLTGLSNRRHFRDLLEQALRIARRTSEQLALVFVDVDSFKSVNDTLGHAAGDLLLQEVATRLRACVRETDTVSRVGGDEFTVILRNLRSAETAEGIARKILERVSEPLPLEQREVTVTCSIGVAMFSDALPDPDQLLKAADTAMYHAKRLGKNNVQSFTHELSAREEERRAQRHTIRHALDAGEFVVHYQPQFDLVTRRIVVVEALARWQSPGQGLMMPAQFITAAERSGQIAEIGAQVLRAACRQAAQWRAAGRTDLRLGVNVSPHEVWRPDFLARLESVLGETGFPPRQLELELAESALTVDTRETRRTFDGLREMGVTLAIDDFGTRHSSLAYIKKLPVTGLKIDTSFIHDLREGSPGLEIAGACIAMGRALHLEVVAEGVETLEQLKLLEEIGCRRAQGFYLAQPRAAESLSNLLPGEPGASVMYAAG